MMCLVCWKTGKKGKYNDCGFSRQNIECGFFHVFLLDKCLPVWLYVFLGVKCCAEVNAACLGLVSLSQMGVLIIFVVSRSRWPSFARNMFFKALCKWALFYIHLEGQAASVSPSNWIESTCRPRYQAREPRRPPPRQRPPERETRRGKGGGGSLTPSIYIRSWSRCILILESHPKPWASWTPLSTTSSSVLLLRPLVWLTTTADRPSPAEKSRPLSVSCCLVNWPSMPCLREPRLSPSTPAPSKLPSLLKNNNNSVLTGPPLPSKETFHATSFKWLICNVPFFTESHF